MSSIGGDLEKQLQFKEMCSNLNQVLDTYFPEKDDYRIIVKPGQFFVLGASTLVTQVIGLCSLNTSDPVSNITNIVWKKTDTVDVGHDSSSRSQKYELIEKGFRYVIINDVYNPFNCIGFDHGKPVPFVILDNEGQFKGILDNDFREMSSEYIFRL